MHFNISPSAYNKLDIDFKNSKESRISISTYRSYKMHIDGKLPADSEVFKLDELKASSMILNTLKQLAVLLFSFLSVREFQKIIESVKNINTFHQRNVLSFRRIGKYLFINFILLSFSWFTFQKGETSGLSFQLGLLVVSLSSFILAEVFKEGNKLLEENKLTV
ncbi:DUF2975 domain-containing protein [Carboxylicivirga marina]|uniref:DUF2975 domain-containing protein n=1 Tax=Carboxylicivirga marina TaxID=2800988 RepID=UPI002598B7C5|nr:DUF2975 domain-containing protein [uncultured Carboxylicivirga sp.]